MLIFGAFLYRTKELLPQRTVLQKTMHLKLISKILVAVVGFTLIGVPVISRAQESTGTTTSTLTAPASQDAPTKHKFNGMLVKISSESFAIAITHKRETLVMAITPQTTFGSKKAPATAADFAFGDKVQGTYSVDGHKDMTLDSIIKKTSKNDSTEPAAASTTSSTPAAQ
jgi:hypothetical protein